MKVELHLCKNAEKATSRQATVVDTSNLKEDADFTFLKAQIDKLDKNKLKNVSNGLSQRINAVDNDIVKKAVYNKWLTKDSLIPKY